MPVTIDLSDEVLASLEAEATRRGVTVAELIADAVAEFAAVPEPPVVPRKFSLAGIGASGGTRFARDADELLAEGFGKD